MHAGICSPSAGAIDVPLQHLQHSCSIAAGGSLGPEAPLLALCAAATSWLARQVRHACAAPGLLTHPLATWLTSCQRNEHIAGIIYLKHCRMNI